MTWRILADAVVFFHLAFVVFAVVGGFLAWRWRWVLFAHIPTLAWATWIELSGGICPLTPLENSLRARSGDAGYSEGFIEHYILPVLYPIGLTRQNQWILAGVLVAINVLAYSKFARQRLRKV
jgi:hypothetical protein